MSQWIKCNTTGIRYRLHATRKHGVGYDRYYTIRYKIEGKEKSEGIGWASEGWSERKVAAILSELKANHLTGTGPRSLSEKREQKKRADQEAVQKEQSEKVRNITFGEIFTERYFPQIQHVRRNPRTSKCEESFFRLWINPIIGNRSMKEIMPLHLEKIKKDMTTSGRAARSIQYCLAIIRQVFNFALMNNLFAGKNPAGSTGGVKRPVSDNRRTRFLTRKEAADLLDELTKRSADVHDIALFSLYTGARAGEVFNLRWIDVDLSNGVALLKDTKNGKNRHVFLTAEVNAVLAQRIPEKVKTEALVFPSRNGGKIVQISDSFNRAVAKLQLNQGVTDRRQCVTFHSLRHTYASWLAMDGVDLYHIKELLGHSDLKLTERYSHLSESVLKAAAMRIQNF